MKRGMATVTEWIPVLVILIGAPVTTIIANHFTRPKIKADISAQYNEMALQLVTPQKQRIDDLEAQMLYNTLECQKRIDVIEKWSKLLYAQIVEAGGVPVELEHVVHLHYRKGELPK